MKSYLVKVTQIKGRIILPDLKGNVHSGKTLEEALRKAAQADKEK